MELILGKGLRTKNLGVNTSLAEHIQQQTEKKRKCSHPGSSMNFSSRNNNNIQEQAFRTQVNSKNNLGKTAIVLLAQETQTTRRQCNQTHLQLWLPQGFPGSSLWLYMCKSKWNWQSGTQDTGRCTSAQEENHLMAQKSKYISQMHNWDLRNRKKALKILHHDYNIFKMWSVL